VAKKRTDTTPRSQVRSALRRLFLRSRERAFAMRRDLRTCQDCGVKASVAKGREVAVCVHHLGDDAGLEAVIDMVYERLLCRPGELTTLCRACHDQRHSERLGKGEVDGEIP
jgi:5-methylcytosine-specific restriction endonuclease McrA